MAFKLRSWSLADIDCLVKYANNKKIAENMTDHFPHPYTVEDGLSFISMARNVNPRHLLAIDIRGEAVGCIGFHLQSDIMKKNAELGFWLSEIYWGQGIMTMAVKEMLVYGFVTFDINRIYARPFGTNLASQRVLEKAGFVLEARFKKTFFKEGRYEDELYYAVRK